MNDDNEEEDITVSLYNDDGSLDLSVFPEVYAAAVAMITDLVTFLEEEGYMEEEFREWRIEYHKRKMH
jgi:hypothetical protein